MRNDDVLLAAVIAGSMTAGVFIPWPGLVLENYILVWLGALLFLNLIRLKAQDLVQTFTRPRQLAWMSLVKLLAIPLAMYGLAYVIYEPFALPVLLLSGISTGLGAPFVVNLVGGRLSLVVGMIVATSLAVPFVLPLLVYSLLGSTISIPILEMIMLLSVALLVPLAAGWATKRWFPLVSGYADRNAFPLSLVFVVLINYSMLAKFSHYFFSDQVFLLQTVAAASLCFAGYSLIGYFVTGGGRQERMAGIVSMTYVNNVLVAVLASLFFGSSVAALAALYNIPYYAGIVAIRRIRTKS